MIMWLALGIGMALIGIASKAMGRGEDASMSVPYSVKQWEPYIRIALAASKSDIPLEFVLAYMTVESGGNPCAVGERQAKGPDGSPKEIGLFQLYNPSDLKALGATGEELRAYCAKPAPGQDDPMKQTRPMTPKEIGRHIGLGIAKINLDRRTVEPFLAKAGITLKPSQRDYWRFIKLEHALPVIVNPGIVNAAKHLGRPPATWSEFRTAYEAIQPRAKYNPKIAKQDGYFRALANAEKTGGAVPEEKTIV